MSLSVPVGTRLLVVGRPAASASLLLRVLAGLAPIDHGRVELAGMSDPSRSGWAGRVGYVGPNLIPFRWMSAHDALATSARLAGMPRSDAERRIFAAAEAVELTADLHTSLGRGDDVLSEKVTLAAALVGEPEVLLLDEPLASLGTDDRTRLLRLPGQRRTILMATRGLMGEASSLFTHIALLRRGRVAIVAPVGDLTTNGLPLSLRGIEQLASLRRRPDTEVGAAPDGYDVTT